jgi:hypothetical protein
MKSDRFGVAPHHNSPGLTGIHWMDAERADKYRAALRGWAFPVLTRIKAAELFW